MKLRVILSKEVNTALKAPKRPDRTVDMQMVEDIIKGLLFVRLVCARANL